MEQNLIKFSNFGPKMREDFNFEVDKIELFRRANLVSDYRFPPVSPSLREVPYETLPVYVLSYIEFIYAIKIFLVIFAHTISLKFIA